MRAAVPAETLEGETRVAAVPETVRRLRALRLEVAVQSGAGRHAFISDADYESAGATIVADAGELYAQADIVLKVRPPTPAEVAALKPGCVLVSFLRPADDEYMRNLAQRGISAVAMDAIPRIARAQSMDALSSMSTLAGYRAALLAAQHLPRMAPLMMTAAGTFQAATALVIGAGVAGLQAVATARRLGAAVRAIDTRPAVREQVESLGARFIPLEVEHETAQTAGGYARDLGEQFYAREQEIIEPHLRQADMVITTALVPGRAAPKLITEHMVASMRRGSVIVDLAIEQGGNCTLTQRGRVVSHDGVTLVGLENLPASMPVHASQMYARNLAALMGEYVQDGECVFDMDNEVIRSTLVIRDGRLTASEPDEPGPAGGGGT